jgi:hypothetical protein
MATNAPTTPNYISLTSGNTDYASQLAAIARRQKYAELLAQQGGKDIDVQSVGGVPTPISPFQGLAKVFQTGMGAYLSGKAGEDEAALDTVQSKKYADALAAMYNERPDMTNKNDLVITGRIDPATHKPGPNVGTIDTRGVFNRPTTGPEQMEAARGLVGTKYESMVPGMLSEAQRTSRQGVEDDRYAAGQARLDTQEAERLAQQRLTNERNVKNDLFAQQEAARDNARATQAHADAMQARTDALEAAAEARRIARENKLTDAQTARENKPENQFQAASAGFADRMAVAEQYLKDPDVMAAATSRYQQNAAGVWGVGNYLTSTAKKSLDQAILAFTNSKLRQESGATIGDSEFQKADKEYFPQPGDPQEIIDQKRKERELVTRGMIRNAGPNYKPLTIDEKKKPDAVDNSEAGKRARLAALNAKIAANAAANAAAKPAAKPPGAP